MRAVRPALVLLTLVAAMLPVSPALASSARVVVHPGHKGTTSFSEVLVAGAPGEANRISVRPAGALWVVRDDGAALSAGTGCTQIESRVAHCTLAAALRVEGGDGDDVLTATGDRFIQLDGGAGNDTVQGHGELDGGAGQDTVIGSSGADFLYGGPGADVLRGGAGADRLGGDETLQQRDDGGFNDVIDGGPGTDTVSYWRRATPVYADLAIGIAGSAGEADRLVSVEDVYGTPASDTLLGDGGPNLMIGDSGDDRIIGRGGDDYLRAGAGVDRVEGGAGDDELIGLDEDDRALAVALSTPSRAHHPSTSRRWL